MGVRTRIPKRLQRSLIGCVTEFMLDAGLGESEIRQVFEDCLTNARRRAVRMVGGRSASYLQSGDLSADLMRAWHRDGRYLDYATAKPRPLHLKKGKSSIRAIALGLNPKADVDNLLGFLIDSRLIRKFRDGRYLPTNDVGVISHVDRFVAEHVIKSMIRLIDTVRRNTQLGPNLKPLIERFAYVSNLDSAEVGEFCNFTKSQGHSYLQVVDDWMERRRLNVGRDRKGKGSGVFAGVHVVAYLGNEVATSGRGVMSTPKKGSEGSDGVGGSV